MKRIIVYFSILINLTSLAFAQTKFIDSLQLVININGGVAVQGMPTNRLTLTTTTTYKASNYYNQPPVSTIKKDSLYQNYELVTPCIFLAAHLSPIHTTNLIARVNAEYAFGWIGSNISWTSNIGFQSYLGLSRFKLLVGYQYINRKASGYNYTYSRDGSSNSYANDSSKEVILKTNYKGIERFIAGISYRFKNNSNLDLYFISESFLSSNSEPIGGGIALENNKSIYFKIEGLLFHPYSGITIYDNLFAKKLLKEGVYFYISIGKTFGWSSSPYKKIINRLIYQ